MKFDTQLQRDVLDQMEWEPGICAAQIGVSAKDGVVTLNGSVSTYAQKLLVERAAKRVRGVSGIANEVTVVIAQGCEKTDTDIAAAAVNALHWDASIPDDKLQVTVRNGWVLLHGEVEWQYQRAAAEANVAGLTGVRGVTNHIQVKTNASPQGIRQQIEQAFQRSAEIDAGRIVVDNEQGKVTLRGNVHSWAEREEAENVAWAAPGIVSVENCLKVVH